MNIAKFLKTPNLKNICKRLLLQFIGKTRQTTKEVWKKLLNIFLKPFVVISTPIISVKYLHICDSGKKQQVFIAYLYPDMGNTADSIVLIRELHVLLNGDLCNVVLRKQPSKGVFRKRF